MDEKNEYAQSCLDAVMEAVWKDDDHNEICRGANSYKITDGKVVFLTQAESYHHCGPVFAHYSVVSRLDMYRTKLLMYRTMVLMAHPTIIRC